MRWPLRYQILFPFAGALLAVVLAISVLEAYLAAQRTQAQIEQQIRKVAQTLLEANFPLTDSVLRQTRGLSGAEFLLTDGGGRLLASSADNFDRGEIRDVLAEVGQPKANYTLGDPVVLGAAEYFHTAITVGPRGTQDAANRLHILYPRSVLQRARWDAAYPPLMVGGILLVVVAVLATVIASRLSRPILELRRQLGRLVEGNFEPVPLPSRNDELRDLIGSVNLLGDQLEESRRAIERTRTFGVAGPAQRRIGSPVAQQRGRSPHRRTVAPAPLQRRRAGQPGRGPAPTDAHRIAPAKVSHRRPAGGAAPGPMRSGASD